MGEAQVDDTLQPIQAQPPAINNTNLIAKEVKERDLVLHIGDISYARGYAGVVRLSYNNFLFFFWLLLVSTLSLFSFLLPHSLNLLILLSLSLYVILVG